MAGVWGFAKLVLQCEFEVASPLTGMTLDFPLGVYIAPFTQHLKMDGIYGTIMGVYWRGGDFCGHAFLAEDKILLVKSWHTPLMMLSLCCVFGSRTIIPLSLDQNSLNG